MERFKALNSYQKGLLLFMVAMSLIFAVIYPKTMAKVGYRYNDAILVPTQENGNTVYSGEIQGKQAEFIVSDDNSVVFHYGDKSYGQYTLKEEPVAIPKDKELNEQIVGIEIRNGNNLLFRGGALDVGDSYWLYNDDGTLSDSGVTFVTGDGIEMDENGNVIDRMEPSASTIYELLNAPELTHKGEAIVWFVAVFICIVNALSILFADELFRLELLFRIRNVENAEASDWEMASRYIGWTVATIMALVVFVIGLQ